jgi:tetratricopeptide (TPR) repeat protein
MRLNRFYMKHLNAVAPPALALLLACTASSVHAQADAVVLQARQATSAGQAQQAYALLEPLEVARAGDPEFDMAFGMAANAVGEFTRAILAFERVLVAQPDNSQARAELGRALFGVGDTRAARALLSEGKLQGIPAVAGETIDQLLQAVDRVDAAGRSSYRGYVELGAGRDTNANSGPAERNFAVPALGGTVIVLDPSGTKTRASFAAAAAGFSGRMVMDPRWSIIGNLTGLVRSYRGGADQFNVRQLDGNLGVSYRVERNEYTVVAQGGTYDIGGDRVRNLAGGVAEWTYRLDGFRQFSSYLQVSRLSYPQQHISDADRTVLGIAYAHQFSNGFLAYGGAYAGVEDERASGVPHLGHKLVGLRGGVQHPLRADLAVFSTLGYEQRHYGGADPSFLVGRHDRQSNLSAGLSWVPAAAWRITPQVAWVQTRSNVAIAAYDKWVVSLTARRDF